MIASSGGRKVVSKVHIHIYKTFMVVLHFITYKMSLSFFKLMKILQIYVVRLEILGLQIFLNTMNFLKSTNFLTYEYFFNSRTFSKYLNIFNLRESFYQ